jgi:hypothetical protein
VALLEQRAAVEAAVRVLVAGEVGAGPEGGLAEQLAGGAGETEGGREGENVMQVRRRVRVG